MPTNLMTVPVTNRRRKLATAVIVAAMLSALGTGSYLTWSASADEQPARTRAAASAPRITINVDSLYTAKADEPIKADTAFMTHVAPERTMAGHISWYGPGFHGRRTANGERFDKNNMTAAHKTLPFGTILRVVDDATGHSVLVRVNDRGPYCGGRILDLSEAAARRLGITGRGTASARLEIYSMPKTADGKRSQISYDAGATPVLPHGFTVKLARIADFDQAITMQQRLEKEGYHDVFLTMTRGGGSIGYTLSIGIFSSERLCKSLLADVSDAFKGAAVTGFDKIVDDEAITRLGDSSTSSHGSL